MTAANTRRRALAGLAFAVSLSCLAPPSSAESESSGAPAATADSGNVTPESLVGLRVRIFANRGQPTDDWLDGRVLRLDGTNLVVERTDGRDARVVMPLALVQQLEIHRGYKRKTKRGFAIGAVAVGIPLAIVGGAVAEHYCHGEAEDNCDDKTTSTFVFLGAFVGAGMGTMVGGGIGAAVGAGHKEDAWEYASIAPARPTVSIGPSHGGVKVALTFRF